MPLYNVQDDDRPMWVVAVDYHEAIIKWRKLVAYENPSDDPDEKIEPAGISKICDDDELIA